MLTSRLLILFFLVLCFNDKYVALGEESTECVATDGEGNCANPDAVDVEQDSVVEPETTVEETEAAVESGEDEEAAVEKETVEEKVEAVSDESETEEAVETIAEEVEEEDSKEEETVVEEAKEEAVEETEEVEVEAEAEEQAEAVEEEKIEEVEEEKTEELEEEKTEEVVDEGAAAEEESRCPSREHVIKCAGKSLDSNGNGLLERSELQSAISSLPWWSRGILNILGSVDKMMVKCDVDGDGAISMDYDMKNNAETCLATCFKRRSFKAAFFSDCDI